MSIEVEVQVDEQGQLQIPEEIQQQLFPGMVVVLKLQDDQPGNGARKHPVPATVADIQFEHKGPEVVEKDGWMVVRGELPPDFDWDTFLYEDRENRLDCLIDWARQ